MSIPNGTLDLDGNSQLVGAIAISNPLPYAGGSAAAPNVVIDNTSSSPVNFISSTGTASTFSVVIQNSGGGALSYYRQGASTITLTSPSTLYRRIEFRRQRNPAKHGLDRGYQRNQCQQRDLDLGRYRLRGMLSNRFGTAPVNLSGMARTPYFLGREGVDNISLGCGEYWRRRATTLTETNFNSTTQASVLNVTAASLSESAGGWTVNFVPSAGTFGAEGRHVAPLPQ